MKLSENFTLQEITQSQVALKNNIDNTPSAEQIINLKELCKNILQPLRDDFQLPIKITSGFRSPELCKKIGSNPDKSQHCANNNSAAADFEIPGVDNKKVFQHIIQNLPFDQVILEYYDEGDINSGWIHCSWSAKPRGQALTKDKQGYELWQ